VSDYVRFVFYGEHHPIEKAPVSTGYMPPGLYRVIEGTVMRIGPAWPDVGTLESRVAALEAKVSR
jgi:hypothetical protein